MRKRQGTLCRSCPARLPVNPYKVRRQVSVRGHQRGKLCENGANAQIWDCVNGNAQMFAFVFAGFEDGVPYWVIRNNALWKGAGCRHVGTGIDGGNNGANIQQWAYHGGDNQKWTLQMAGDGYFYIRSKLDPNLVLDLLYGSTDNGTNLQLCSFHGGENQQWYLWDNTINLSAEWTST